MRIWVAAGLGLALGASAANAGEIGDQLAQSLYERNVHDLATRAVASCDAGEGDACFALGLTAIIDAYETLAAGFYRHGAIVPETPLAGIFLGFSMDEPAAPANPDPKPLTYEQFRELLEEFSTTLDIAAQHMERAGQGTPFVVHIDPWKVRIDFDGDGEAGPDETLGVLLGAAGSLLDLPEAEAPISEKTKSKTGASTDAPSPTLIGFDNADAIWFAGYTTVAATPVEMALAHDFSGFFDSYFHRIFPHAGLPMEDYSRAGSMLMMDAESDAQVADLVAAIHMARFPVADAQRLAAVPARLSRITAYSRQNWEMILAETDDDRELLPSPRQTSLVPDQAVTQEIVDAWLATLDQLDRIIDGDLLLPHWRFNKGFNLKTYFETATETDLVMLFTGQGALPYLGDGPIADASAFAELNRVMGDEWPMFAVWFN